MAYSIARIERLLKHFMMKPIIILLALFMLTFMSSINEQSNAKTFVDGYNECQVAMPADTKKVTFYQGETSDNDTFIKGSKPDSEPQKSSPAMQTCLSGKCVNNIVVIL
jgi:hypothetical protein